QQYPQLFAPLALNKTNIENDKEELSITNNEQENSLTFLDIPESTSSSSSSTFTLKVQKAADIVA
ncbi:36666_t:CDS:2, partial [Racocetra persica]